MRTIVIDYNRIGRARTFRTTLLVDELDGLTVGTHVLISGDGISDREAMVTDLTDGGRQAEFTFCD